MKQKGEEGGEDESEEEGESSECITAWHYSVLTLTRLHGSERV
jgi:hypothetical protein